MRAGQAGSNPDSDSYADLYGDSVAYEDCYHSHADTNGCYSNTNAQPHSDCYCSYTNTKPQSDCYCSHANANLYADSVTDQDPDSSSVANTKYNPNSQCYADPGLLLLRYSPARRSRGL